MSDTTSSEVIIQSLITYDTTTTKTKVKTFSINDKTEIRNYEENLSKEG